eukprot:6931643-Pyramimonas_sp.AAC.1
MLRVAPHEFHPRWPRVPTQDSALWFAIGILQVLAQGCRGLVWERLGSSEYSNGLGASLWSQGGLHNVVIARRKL